MTKSIWKRVSDFRPWETRLAYLRRLESKLEKGMAREQKAARGNRDSLQSIQESYEFELMCNFAEIETERTQKLLRKCREYDVPIPLRTKDSDYWCYFFHLDQHYLSREGFTFLKTQLHEAKSRNFDAVARWVGLFAPTIGAVTGLIGAVIGVISVWGSQ